MLVLIRLFPKGGLKELCSAIDVEKRDLYWKDVKPLYAIREEGKRYISIVLDVKNLDAIQNLFLKNLGTIASVSQTRTIPIMSPIYFPLPKDHPKDLVHYMVFLRVEPEKYDDVYNSIIDLKYPKNVILTYISYSFGDDDIIVSMLAEGRETAQKFANNKIGNIKGVNALDVSRVMRNIDMLPKDKLRAHKERLLYSAPAGQKGRIKNKAAYEKYLKQKTPMTVIVRLFAKKSLKKLWADIENNLEKFESKDLIPLYASQQEAKDYITVIFEASNFEVLKDVLVKNLPTLVEVRKTRTIPMLAPTYFLMPKDHPKNLERYLVTLRTDPSKTRSVRSKIIGATFPKASFLTYLTYSLGQDDILLSILTESHKSVQELTKSIFGNMDGVQSYEISNQLKTKRLTSKTNWRRHQRKFLSSFDKEYTKEYDLDYDWTDDFQEYAAMTGAFVHEFE